MQACRKAESGNVLVMVLFGIAAIAMLTYLVTQGSEQQSNTLDRQTIDDGVSRLLGQASLMSDAVYQMVTNGEDPAVLYSTLSLLRPGDVGFETPPHSTKLYHRYGGGIQYMPSSISNSLIVATGITINKNSIVTGVGETDAVIGDILFTAHITALEYCQRINEKMTGSTAIPVMTTADFDDLFTAGNAVTIDGTNCADCVDQARMCISNGDNTAWGYYASLLPG